MTMNMKRLIIAIAVGFVFIFVSDMLIHGVWMRGDYAATMQLWRPESEMQQHLSWMMGGQLLASTTFVVVWAMGFAGRGLAWAIVYGLLMGLFGQVNTLIMYSVMPLPLEITTKWFVAGLAQAVLLGLVTNFIYTPATLK
jgi:hypothetical protein